MIGGFEKRGDKLRVAARNVAHDLDEGSIGHRRRRSHTLKPDDAWHALLAQTPFSG
ncbi:MAG: hypothetical protein V4454_14115 [Pseudomonadota bacterium]